MALFIRVCTGRNSLNGLLNRLYKVSKYNNVQVAHISGRINRIRGPRPPPFPYWEDNVSVLQKACDYQIERYDENSRLIVVEGPIAAGKDKFARELAIELDMGYMPAPSFEYLYGDGYGNDLRKVAHTVPERIQPVDVERFLTNPKHMNVPLFELSYYMLKLDNYIESLCHILSTGEGVVINRCHTSNYIFMKAMYNAGYINNKCRNFYDKVAYVLQEITLKPHLVIYLDIPVNIVQERIKKRAIPYEVNSKVLTKEYLTDIETTYKEEYLPHIEEHSFLLMYDWVDGGDISDVVDDIERIHECESREHRRRLEDWELGNIQELKKKRNCYSREERCLPIIALLDDIEDYDVSEMYLFGEDKIMHDEFVTKNLSKYSFGYNRQMGDNVLWKTKEEMWGQRVITNKELLETQ